jgi:FkbH-like protein
VGIAAGVAAGGGSDAGGTMKLIEAVTLCGAPAPAEAPAFQTALVCGFAPLHLQTFFMAHLRQLLPGRAVTVKTGLFGDVEGTLKDVREWPVDAVAVALEWPDLDQRLGIRQIGGWSPAQLDDIVSHSTARLDLLLTLIRDVASTTPVAIALPSLPLPPVFFNAPWQAGIHETKLRAILWQFAADAAALPRVRVVSQQMLDAGSPFATRFNIAGTWNYGFPYQHEHAEQLGALLARAVENRPPKKGLITDLDDTLWAGIVGDDGVENISWDVDRHTQAHGLYQQMLSTLSEEGVLVGVVSKNDPAIVEAAFERNDLLLRRDRVFPFMVSWGSKADAVTQVLSLWNIGADSVVFVDDNPIELAEVQAAHPEIECITFPRKDPAAVYQLANRLRHLFGRGSLSSEDALRLESLRAAGVHQRHEPTAEGYSESLLEHAEAELILDFTKDPNDARAFELVSKTNQFNLNGRRPTERAWSDYLREPRSFMLTASYRDRFGALGKIAVVAGRASGSHLAVDTWVMSCRAFARRIEHQCLNALFDRFAVDAVRFDFEETPRNLPIARFLASFPPGPDGHSVSRLSFQAACPRLFHRVVFRDACPAGN